MTDSSPDGAPSSLHRTTLLILAITLHNIPEGLAVGVAFGAVGAGIEGATIPAAIALAIGMASRISRKGRPFPCRCAHWACGGGAAFSSDNFPP